MPRFILVNWCVVFPFFTQVIVSVFNLSNLMYPAILFQFCYRIGPTRLMRNLFAHTHTCLFFTGTIHHDTIWEVGGIGNVLPIFEFSFQFSIGLHWILQICLFKFWKLEILCIKLWKLKVRRGAALHSTQNDGIFKFRLEDRNYRSTTPQGRRQGKLG